MNGELRLQLRVDATRSLGGASEMLSLKALGFLFVRGSFTPSPSPSSSSSSAASSFITANPRIFQIPSPLPLLCAVRYGTTRPVRPTDREEGMDGGDHMLPRAVRVHSRQQPGCARARRVLDL